jgi:hypothetical protein
MRVSAVPGDRSRTVSISATQVGANTMLTASGILDTTSYLLLRDRIIKEALEEPQAVIIDVSELRVPAESAWAVFTSARWHVGRWPEVPIALVCEHVAGRNAIARNGVGRYVPVYATVESAITALSRAGPRPYRRRARADLPAELTSLRRSRELVAEWLTAWSQADMIPVAKIIVTTLVENVLAHTDSPPAIRLETDGVAVTVAVEDTSRVPAGMREAFCVNLAPSGLHIVSALCRMWGNSPTPAGKTVWVVIGPENRL